MKTTGKLLLFAATTAMLSSAATAMIVKTSLRAPSDATELASDPSDPFGGSVYKAARTTVPQTDFTKAAESTINGVVSIKSFATPQQRSQMGGFDPFFEYFFGSPGRQEQPQQPREQQRGLGSGVIISADGYIVTNNHVIDGAERLEITLNDNRTFDAEVIGTDPTTDLALIKIDADNLPVIPMGDSESLRVGEWVLAVGNPFGFTSTVTTGIVSAKGRSISEASHSRRMGIESYIQTDAAVNPGNSGGALVTLDGDLIGINTAIYSQTGNYAGYSFAIPTSIVKKVVADLKQYGTVQRAVLGVGISDLTNELAKEKGITAVTKGVYVGNVQERSSAREAGIKEGDVITAIDGIPTNKSGELQEQVSKHKPGDKIRVTVVRDNKTMNFDVNLLNSKGTTSVTKSGDFSSLGCAFVKADKKTLEKIGINNGVRVIDIQDGPVKEAMVRNGFIIVTVNDIRVSSPADIEKIYNTYSKADNEEDRVLILRGFYPTGKRGIYAIDLNN